MQANCFMLMPSVLVLISLLMMDIEVEHLLFHLCTARQDTYDSIRLAAVMC